MDLRLDRLRERRKKLGLTKKQAADRLHVTAQAYSNYEMGARTPTYPVALMMAIALETSLAYLTGDTDDSAPDLLLLKLEDAADVQGFISQYTHLSPSEKKVIRDLLEIFASNKRRP